MWHKSKSPHLWNIQGILCMYLLIILGGLLLDEIPINHSSHMFFLGTGSCYSINMYSLVPKRTLVTHSDRMIMISDMWAVTCLCLH